MKTTLIDITTSENKQKLLVSDLVALDITPRGILIKIFNDEHILLTDTFISECYDRLLKDGIND